MLSTIEPSTKLLSFVRMSQAWYKLSKVPLLLFLLPFIQVAIDVSHVMQAGWTTIILMKLEAAAFYAIPEAASNFEKTYSLNQTSWESPVEKDWIVIDCPYNAMLYDAISVFYNT